MPDYVVRIVELDGTLVRTLDKANVLRVRKGMNQDVGEATFTYPKTDPNGAAGQATDVRLLTYECEIRKDGTTIHRGPMTRREGQSSEGAMTVTSPGAGWYFGRRFINTNDRDLLTNGWFEDLSLDPWVETDCTATLVSSPVHSGAGAAELVGTTTFFDQFIEQTVEVTAGGNGTTLTVFGYFNVTDWTGPALNSRGLFIESRNGGVVETFNDHEGVIDDDTAEALNNWQRASATLWIPPGATRDVYVRLYAPNGTILWDRVELVADEGLDLPPGGEDIGETANRIVDFAQSTSVGKSDLGIATTTPPTTGVLLEHPKAWLFSEHTPVDRALNDELVPLGIDWDIDPATRTFTVYYPRKGTDRSGSVTLRLTSNVANYSLSEDGAQSSTDITVVGDGVDVRDESFFINNTWTGGLVLQGVHSAPPGSSGPELDFLAFARGSHDGQIARVLSVQVYGSLVDVLELGDTVEVDIVDGDAVAISGNWRIVSWTLDCRTDTLLLDLNEA